MNRATSFEEDGRGAQERRKLVRPFVVTAEDEREFLNAMEQYKRRSGRLFPTWSEILEVLRSLGYEKRIWRPVGKWATIPPGSIEDGIEAESNVGMTGWFSRAETSV